MTHTLAYKFKEKLPEKRSMYQLYYKGLLLAEFPVNDLAVSRIAYNDVVALEALSIARDLGLDVEPEHLFDGKG